MEKSIKLKKVKPVKDIRPSHGRHVTPVQTGAGFWKDFGQGFLKGLTGAAKIGLPLLLGNGSTPSKTHKKKSGGLLYKQR